MFRFRKSKSSKEASQSAVETGVVEPDQDWASITLSLDALGNHMFGERKDKEGNELWQHVRTLGGIGITGGAIAMIGEIAEDPRNPKGYAYSLDPDSAGVKKHVISIDGELVYTNTYGLSPQTGQMEFKRRDVYWD